MFRAFLSRLAILAFLAVPAFGTETDTSRSARIEPAREKFHVYGGRCSRSIQLQGTYDNIKDAFAAAETFRTKENMRFVTVRTGAHDRDYFGTSATQYKVYRLETKCGNWLVHATVDSDVKAKELADKLKSEEKSVEIVGYYATK